MKRQFCLPCFLELQKAGKHNIERIDWARNQKVTCWRCKRRRYGSVYEISRKVTVSKAKTLPDLSGDIGNGPEGSA